MRSHGNQLTKEFNFKENTMKTKLSSFYTEVLTLAQTHSNNGASLQDVYGGLSAALNRIGSMMHKEYEKQATIQEWEAIQKRFEPNTPDLPLVEAAEDN